MDEPDTAAEPTVSEDKMGVGDTQIPSFEELFERVRNNAEIAQGIEARAALNVLAKLIGFDPEKIQDMQKDIDTLAGEVGKLREQMDKVLYDIELSYEH